MDANARLSDYWRNLANDLSLPDGITDSVQTELLTRYGEPARHYHTAKHIVALLDLARTMPFDDTDTARLAIVFHDVIYDPARSHNEAESAAMMRACLEGHVNGDRLARAAAMIDATQGHQATGDFDTDLVLDLDMAILGQPWPVYEGYARGVMAEYLPIYGAEAYRLGRVQMFIDPTLGKAQLFLTPFFRHLDMPARENLLREKSWLQGGAA